MAVRKGVSLIRSAEINTSQSQNLVADEDGRLILALASCVLAPLPEKTIHESDAQSRSGAETFAQDVTVSEYGMRKQGDEC